MSDDAPIAPTSPRSMPRDVSLRPAPAGWPFARLTDQQRRERFDFEIAARRGELRRLPTCFGDLL
jgi:hypothetical protein